MKIICEMCGKTSTNDKVCSNCGEEILSEDKVSTLPSHLMWGWATFDFNNLDRDMHIQAVKSMKDYWTQLEEFTVLNLVESQLRKFKSDQKIIKVLVREDFYLKLSSKLQNEFKDITSNFEPIGYFAYASELNKLL